MPRLMSGDDKTELPRSRTRATIPSGGLGELVRSLRTSTSPPPIADFPSSCAVATNPLSLRLPALTRVESQAGIFWRCRDGLSPRSAHTGGR